MKAANSNLVTIFNKVIIAVILSISLRIFSLIFILEKRKLNTKILDLIIG